ncbi:MAG: hypothetical protein C0594_15310 [Marinilabiliales bacterium]|nr:MAG: hypothetical protein C0594_15310 [Marinilabiliales bacterium]
MDNNFLCPKCSGALNISKKIIFSVKNKAGKPGIIFLSPEVGNYTAEHNPSFDFELGDQLDFSCPMCGAELTAGENNALAEVILEDSENKKSKILFSKIAGEKCTYKVTEENYEAYGENSHKYINYINLSLNK